MATTALPAHRYSPRQFAIFRIALGVYLAVYFLILSPYAPELLSSSGMVPDPRADPAYMRFPNVLLWRDDPAAVRIFTASLALLAVAFAGGVARRVAAVTLWYGLACVMNRNRLLMDPGTPFVGWLLLASALVPPGEPLSWKNRSWRAKDGWRLPSPLFFGAWLILAVSYTNSGVAKLRCPEWIDGSAFQLFLQNPLHRQSVGWALFHGLPHPLLVGISWLGLAAEVLCAPLSLWHRTRPIAWALLLGMHLIILSTVNAAILSLGAILPLVFTFDSRWVEAPRRPHRPAPPQQSAPPQQKERGRHP